MTTEQEEKFERYIRALKEDFDHKLDAVLEYVKDVPKIKEDIVEIKENIVVIKEVIVVIKDDIVEIEECMVEMKEDRDEITKDVAVIKVTSQDHEQRLKKVEARA